MHIKNWCKPPNDEPDWCKLPQRNSAGYLLASLIVWGFPQNLGDNIKLSRHFNYSLIAHGRWGRHWRTHKHLSRDEGHNGCNSRLAASRLSQELQESSLLSGEEVARFFSPNCLKPPRTEVANLLLRGRGISPSVVIEDDLTATLISRGTWMAWRIDTVEAA